MLPSPTRGPDARRARRQRAGALARAGLLWGAAACAALLIHLGAVWLVLTNWRDPIGTDEASPAIAIDLAPAEAGPSPAAESAATPAAAPEPVSDFRPAEPPPEPLRPVADPMPPEPVPDPPSPAAVEAARPEPAPPPDLTPPEPMPLPVTREADLPAPSVALPAPAPAPPLPVTPPRPAPARPVAPPRKLERAARPDREPPVARPAQGSPRREAERGPAAGAAQAERAGAGAASAAAAAAWRGSLVAHLNRFKRYPADGTGNGVATIAFTVARSGAVTGARLVVSSGDRALDAEALALPRRASPVPPPPSDMPGGAIAVAAPIRFAR